MYTPRRIEGPCDAANLVRNFLEDADREMFLIVCLSSKHEPTAIHTVSIGTLNASVVHPREVFKAAILSNATGIIMAHNHPSGDPAPSKEDIILTRRLIDAGELLGITVIDHIIVGIDRHCSLKEMNKLF